MIVRPKRHMMLEFVCHERSCKIALSSMDRCEATVENGKAYLEYSNICICLPFDEFMRCFMEV